MWIEGVPNNDATEDIPLDGDGVIDMDSPAAGAERSRLRPRPNVGRAGRGHEGFLYSGQSCDKSARTPGVVHKAADAPPSMGGGARGPGEDWCLSVSSSNRSCGSPSFDQAQKRGHTEAFSPNHIRLVLQGST
jgi:hypothetical protein